MLTPNLRIGYLDSLELSHPSTLKTVSNYVKFIMQIAIGHSSNAF
jgi:hypothetical protein